MYDMVTTRHVKFYVKSSYYVSEWTAKIRQEPYQTAGCKKVP